MDIEKEIELLKEKLALLEKIKELQEIIKENEKVNTHPFPYIPYPVPTWPYYPQPYITITPCTADPVYEPIRVMCG